MRTLTDPMETTRQEEQGRMEIRLVDGEDPGARVTLVFEDPRRCRELGRVLHETALQMERAEARARAEEGGE